jgi:3-oxoacyl-[acyl-carrier protein] reductase
MVTGGGTGIGRATAESLARAGAGAVVINYSRSEDEARETAGALSPLGCQGLPWRADVSDDTQVREMVARVVARFGRLDVLVNNAGTTQFIAHADLDQLTDEVWNGILKVNLMGAMYCSRAAAPELKRAKGAIVNISSIASLRASGSSIPYGTSKAALTQLTRHLALALAPEVRVNAVAPGMVAGRWFRSRFGDEATDSLEQAMAGTTPLGRIVTPLDVADVVMGFLGADMVTGETLIVDGGKHLAY